MNLMSDPLTVRAEVAARLEDAESRRHAASLSRPRRVRRPRRLSGLRLPRPFRLRAA